jgi:thioester reductase-like protein
LLGHHLLSAFCKQASVRKVICIAVRRLSERLASGELPSPADTHNRVEYHEGDLALPRFGLPASEEARIFDEVDAVVHNGADTSHMKHYSAVRGVNVESTKQLVRLCVPRRVPLHYVSSAGMALASGLDPFPSVAAARSADILSRDWARGYICSKWVCERLLENANAEYGLPVWIQRPSTIIREGEDAVTERAGFDWVNTLMEYSHKIGGVPRIENNTGAFDLVRVQTCCDDIVSGVMTNKPRLSNGMTYQNNVGDVVIPMAQLKDIALRAGHSEPYAMMSWEEWTSKAIAAGLHPAVAALVEIVDRPGGPAYPSLSREIDEATYV